MDILKKINWKQPKYMLPLIIYFPLLFVGYFVIDLFHTEKAEIPDNSLTTTEYLNPVLPDAKMKGDGIGNKYESMVKSYGKIDDLTAMENIDRNNEEEKESYDSKYSDEERQLLESQEAAKLAEIERQLQASAQKGQEIANGSGMSEADRLARSQQREQEAMEELNRALAQARLQGQQAMTPPADSNADNAPSNSQPSDKVEGKISVNERAVKGVSDDVIIDEYALDVSLDTLTAKTTHKCIDVRSFGNYNVIDFNVIKQTKPYTRTIYRLYIFINNGFDKVRLRVIFSKGVEVIGSDFDLLHNLLCFIIIRDTFYSSFIHTDFTFYFV